MAIFNIQNRKLSPIREKSIDLEKDIQKLTEENLEVIFGLQFVSTEFALQNFRIDTLAFDKEANAFVIVEYKRDRSFSVIDQGYAYLALMLNNKADFILEYNEKAKENLKSYQNISFVNQDAEKLNLGRKFDCITASYLPKYCTPDILVKNCIEHLNNGGKIILHDFTYPKNKFIRKMWNFYFIILDLVGFFVPDWKKVFVSLPHLIRTTYWVAEYEKTMKKNGLKVYKQDLTFGTSAIIVGTKII